MMRRHALVWVILAAVVATASGDAESDYWREWRTRPEHGDEGRGRGPWYLADYVKIEPLSPAMAGQPVTVRARAWFPSSDLPPAVRIQLPVGWRAPVPPARVKARVFWGVENRTELLSDAMVETYIGPKDTLDVRAVLRGKIGEGLHASAYGYLYSVVGGVPVKDVRPVWVRDPGAWDHWAFAGWGVMHHYPNPLNPAEFVSERELDRIHQNAQQAFIDRLARARVGTVEASPEAQGVIDSLLPRVDEPTRRQLVVACDYMAARTKTRPGEAARFVGKQVGVWARGQEDAWMGGSEQAVAEWAVGAAERGLLEDMYKSTVELLKDPKEPIWKMYKALFDAKEGKITWDEAQARVESLMGAYPDDPDVKTTGPFIRDTQLPEWRRRYERRWWERWWERLRGKEPSEGERPAEEERYTWFFQGYWKYHDHAVTRYDGLSPETTDEAVRRGYAYINFESEWGPVLRGPFLLGEDGYFQFGDEDFPDEELDVRASVLLYGRFPGFQWPQIYVMEAPGVDADRIYSAYQHVYHGNAAADGWVEGATAGTDPAGATAVTDEEGWFALAMAQGVYTLRVWAAGHYPVMIPGVTCPSDVGTVFLTTHGTPERSSLACTFQGRALLVGDVVEAWDPDGVLCGAWEVATEGCYGPMTVCGDDAATQEVDEGAEEGDTLRFTINGFTAVCLGPDDPVWPAGGGPYRVELTAHDAPPTSVTDLAVAVVDSLALLQWTAVTEDTSGNPEPSIRTFIHRSPVAYFEPGEGTEIDWIFGESEYWDWESGLGEPNAHSFYRLVIRDNLGQDSAPSNTMGEFEFGTGGAPLAREAGTARMKPGPRTLSPGL